MSGLSCANETELSAAISAARERGAAIVCDNVNRLPPASKWRDREIWQPDLSFLKAVVEHQVADQVIAAETGMLVGDLQRWLAKDGQFLPARVPANWTLMDAINRGETGHLEHGYGGARELVLGLRAVLSDGRVVNTGGRVVKNVTGYDVTKLLVGSRGWLAVPIAAQLRLYALPTVSATLVWSGESLSRLMSAAQTLMRSGVPASALELVQNDQLRLGAGGSYALLAQFMSQPGVEEELLQAAQVAVGACEEKIGGRQESEVWDYLTSLFLGGSVETQLQVVAAPSAVPVLLSKLPGGCRWQFRPSKGRLTIITNEPHSLLEPIASFSRQSSVQIAAACADDSYNYHLHTLPEEQHQRRLLNQRIKNELDPTGVLNPFVLV